MSWIKINNLLYSNTNSSHILEFLNNKWELKKTDISDQREISFEDFFNNPILNINNPLPIGLIFPSDIVPSKTDNLILLSKESDFNTGKLSKSETFIDANQQRIYQDIIIDTDSPMYLTNIDLINSVYDISSGEEIAAPAVISANELKTFRANQFQGHYHESLYNNIFYNPGGSYFSISYTGTANHVVARNPVSDTVNGTPRTGKTTEQNNFTRNYYMVYK